MTLEFQQADGQMDSPVQQFRYCAISRSLQSYYTSVPGQAAEVSSGGVTYKSKNIVYVYFSFFSLLLFFCVLFPLKLRTLEVFQLNFLCKTLDIYSFRFSKSEDTSDALVIASNTHTHTHTHTYAALYWEDAMQSEVQRLQEEAISKGPSK